MVVPQLVEYGQYRNLSLGQMRDNFAHKPQWHCRDDVFNICLRELGEDRVQCGGESKSIVKVVILSGVIKRSSP